MAATGLKHARRDAITRHCDAPPDSFRKGVFIPKPPLNPPKEAFVYRKAGGFHKPRQSPMLRNSHMSNAKSCQHQRRSISVLCLPNPLKDVCEIDKKQRVLLKTSDAAMFNQQNQRGDAVALFPRYCLRPHECQVPYSQLVLLHSLGGTFENGAFAIA